MKKIISKIKKSLKNSGSSLVLVIVALGFIGILTGALLTAVGYTYRLKMYDYNAKSNFYYLEQAMDEIYAGVGIQTMKDMGFNCLRKHIKIEPDRWYYHCDRLGMLVWQDMPSGGGTYSPLVMFPPLMLNGLSFKDSKYKLFARENESGRSQYYRDLESMID